jgi:hypothetical protein
VNDQSQELPVELYRLAMKLPQYVSVARIAFRTLQQVVCRTSQPGFKPGRWRLLSPGGMLALNQALSSQEQATPNNSFKPKPLRYSKNHGSKSLPCFCLHYAFRLNSGVRQT